MTSIARFLALTVVGLTGLSVLGASSASAATLPGGENVSGCSKKDQTAIVAAVAATPKQKVSKIDSGQCVAGWAVVFPITADPNSIEYTQVLKKSGGKWALVERSASVCGAGPVKGDYYKRPAGAQVAREIYISACLTN